jgi:CubicO group peptidase (beta-lactamase class C family)
MDGRVPSVSIAAVGPEGDRWMRSLGTSDLRASAPATPETAYLWFSMTKIVTATAAMRLVDRGDLSLDDRVVDRYPPFLSMRPADRAARVTVRHLLSHSAGIADPIPIRWVHPVEQDPPDPGAFLDEVLRKHRKLRFEPGSRARYSNVGFLVLGQVIAAAAGQPFVEHVREAVLAPLGMDRSGFRYLEGMPRAVGPTRPLLRTRGPSRRAGPSPCSTPARPRPGDSAAIRRQAARSRSERSSFGRRRDAPTFR